MPIVSTKFTDMFSYARNGEASAIGVDGYPSFVPENVPRELYIDGKRVGILLERPSYNILSDSLDPKEQTVTLDAGTYTFMGYGQGDASIQGGSVSLLYKGSPVTLSLSAQTDITISPESSLEAFQLEEGETHSSLIRTPQNAGEGREEEYLTHGRDKFFSRNSGTFIGEMVFNQEEKDAVYFSVENDAGDKWKIIGNDSGFIFRVESSGEEIQFINPLGIEGIMRFCVTYNSTEGYVRCYINEEVGELSLVSFYKPSRVTFANGPVIPSSVILDRYEYRPKALGNGEISKIFDYEFELAYDFEVSPAQVNNWADMIFLNSLYRL